MMFRIFLLAILLLLFNESSRLPLGFSTVTTPSGGLSESGLGEKGPQMNLFESGTATASQGEKISDSFSPSNELKSLLRRR